MRNHRFISLLLTLVMALSLCIPAAAEEPLLILPAPGQEEAHILISPAPAEQEWLVPQVKDYDGRLTDAAGAWCSDAIVTCYESGLMEGRTATKFDAASKLTYAQITVITARLYDLLNGGDGKLPPAAEGEAWYQPAANLLKEAGSDEMLQLLLRKLDREDDRPNTPCARRDFVWMLSAVLPESALTPINDVTVIPDEAHNRTDFLPFYQAGILGGSDAYGTFNGESPLTRGAAAAILARLVDPAQRLTFTLKSFDLCRDVLQVAPDTVLLTLDGKPVTAEEFAYVCVSSGALHQVSPESVITADTPLEMLRYAGAYTRVLQQLTEQDFVLSLTAEDEARLAAAAKAKAGDSGISEKGWLWGLRYETEVTYVTMYYMMTFGETGGPRDEMSGISQMEAATFQAYENVVLKPTPALDALDWNAIHQRALKTPCTSDIPLS